MPGPVDDHRVVAPAKQGVHPRVIKVTTAVVHHSNMNCKILLVCLKVSASVTLTATTTLRKGRNEGNIGILETRGRWQVRGVVMPLAH